jgi:hypothetical protein
LWELAGEQALVQAEVRMEEEVSVVEAEMALAGVVGMGRCGGTQMCAWEVVQGALLVRELVALS